MQPTPTPTPAPGPQHPQSNLKDAQYTEILDDLIAMATAQARRIHETAMAGTTPAATAAEATIAFDRVSRCVRRCIALARHIQASPAPHARPDARTQARAQIIRRVENAILSHGRVTPEARPHADALRAELTERLDNPALEFDLGSRPVADIIAEICEDLGVTRQGLFQRRTPADLHALHQKAASHPAGWVPTHQGAPPIRPERWTTPPARTDSPKPSGPCAHTPGTENDTR